MTRVSILVAIALLAAGCASEEATDMFTAYHDSDFAIWKGPGPANLSGQASVKLPGGRIATCAGQTVTLIPATAYNMELEQTLVSGQGYPANYERKARRYDHQTTCDASGRFVFRDVPSLNWIVVTSVEWKDPSFFDFVLSGDGRSVLVQEVALADGDNTLALSDQDAVGDRP